MRGPSNEDVAHHQSYLNMPQHYQNSHYFDSQMPEQHSSSENANFNGNNRSSYMNGSHSQRNESNANYHQTHGQQSPLSPNSSNPFAEYAWMVNPDEFERQVMEQMQQEEYLEACFQEMWQEEESDGDWYIPSRVSDDTPQSSNDNIEALDKMSLNEPQPPTMLNPNAAEFVPRQAVAPQ
ncbi:uncharacterized protein LOC120335531 isoform X1 [Styela clava]